MNQIATKKSQKPRHYAFWLLLAFSLTPACATTKNSSTPTLIMPLESVDPEAPVGYEIEVGRRLRQSAPLPDMEPAQVTLHFADGSVRRYLGARGWDMNQDGRVDMIEILDTAGKAYAYVFDFDADGRVDFLKIREEHPLQTIPDSWRVETSSAY